MSRYYDGGKAVDSGGFGCVFLPSLKCDNTPYDKSLISKLMINKDSDEEYQLIQQFNSRLKSIPNYTKYFLLNNFQLCHPSQITQEDLINYDDKCSALIENGITSSNINNNLQKIKTINMPFGGINVRKFMTKNEKKWVELNNSLIDLLKNGIMPMNKLNVFHGDLKSSNMLVNDNANVKIIDWGLSFIRDDIGIIPKNVTRPIHFNLPVSIVLFNKLMDEKLAMFFAKTNELTYENARMIVINFLEEYLKTHSDGHLKILMSTIERFNSFTSVLSKQNNKNPMDYVVDYIAEVLYKYTVNKTFNKLAYLNEVYLKNIDIWGFLTVYLDFFDIIYDKKKFGSKEMAFLGKIKKIFMETLFLNSTTPINILNLIPKLMNLNTDLKKITSSAKGGKRTRRNIRSGRNKKSKRRKNKSKKNVSRKIK